MQRPCALLHVYVEYCTCMCVSAESRDGVRRTLGRSEQIRLGIGHLCHCATMRRLRAPAARCGTSGKQWHRVGETKADGPVLISGVERGTFASDFNFWLRRGARGVEAVNNNPFNVMLR